MMRAPNNINANAVREEAAGLLQAGHAVIKLKPRSKKPWSDELHAASMITWDNVNTLNADDNIGVYFTEGGSLKDLDYDYKSSADLAEEVGLAEATASFGRPSVGVTHSLYNSPGCNAKKFELPEGQYPKPLPIKNGEPSLTVLEIRGAANTLTMMPPSVHPDTGETLAWRGNRRDPLEVPAEQLRAVAGQHALAATVLYFYPENAATRFNVRMALAGALIRSGMNADDAKRYVQAVAYLGGDPKWREDFTDHTEQRLEDDKPATGIPKLVETLQLPEACEQTFRAWLQQSVDVKSKLVEMNKRYCVLPIGGKTRVATWGEDPEFPGHQTIAMCSSLTEFRALHDKYRI